VGAKNMAIGLLDKLTNFLMPVEEVVVTAEADRLATGRASHLLLHKGSASFALKVIVCSPLNFDDVCLYADYLKLNTVVILNYEGLDGALQQRISDFMNGVCSVTGGKDQRIADYMMLYVPATVTVNKELYAYNVPPYGKRDL
jgi:cell division inhibitor SepF